MQRIPFARAADTRWARGTCTQVFGSILRVSVKIGKKMTTALSIKPKIRKLNPARLARITEGWRLLYYGGYA